MTKQLLASAFVLAMAGATAPTAVAAAGPDAALPASTYQESFEEGFGGWEPDSDGLARDWKITRIPGDVGSRGCEDGSWCLSYYLDGRDDDGTIWVQRQFIVPPNSELAIKMNFWLFNEVDSPVNAWPVVAYIGLAEPAQEVDFTIVGHTQETVGWNQYFHAQPVTSNDTGAVWIAFGISATWEVERTHLVDLVEVTGTS